MRAEYISFIFYCSSTALLMYLCKLDAVHLSADHSQLTTLCAASLRSCRLRPECLRHSIHSTSMKKVASRKGQTVLRLYEKAFFPFSRKCQRLNIILCALDTNSKSLWGVIAILSQSSPPSLQAKCQLSPIIAITTFWVGAL